MLSTRFDLAFLVIVVVSAGACASGGSARAAGTTCDLRPADSLFLEAGPVYRDCAVDRPARPVGPEIKPDFADLPGCQSVTLEFVVGPTGEPEIETARVESTNNEAFALAVLTTLPKWRYEPAQVDGAPVRQIVRADRFAGFVRVKVQPGVGPGLVGYGGSLKNVPRTC